MLAFKYAEKYDKLCTNYLNKKISQAPKMMYPWVTWEYMLQRNMFFAHNYLKKIIPKMIKNERWYITQKHGNMKQMLDLHNNCIADARHFLEE